MKKNMENVIAQNRMTYFKDDHVNDTIINMVKLIKQENWDKIMKNSDSLFECQTRKLGHNNEEQ